MHNEDRHGGAGAGPAAAERGGGWRAGLLAAAFVCLAPLAAACSSSPAHSGASSDGGTGALAYSRCMRAHGVKNFPDPNSQGGISISSNSGVNPNSAQYAAANQVCQSKMGSGPHLSQAQQAKLQANMLKFADCMRTHGEPGYPDPSFGSGGRVTQKISKGSGVDPRSPQFQAAEKACMHFQAPGPGQGHGGFTTSGGG